MKIDAKIPVADVAMQMKTTPLNVMMHIKRGLLAGEEIEGAWFVPADSLASYLEQAGGAAHGSLCHSSCQHGCQSCGSGAEE